MDNWRFLPDNASETGGGHDFGGRLPALVMQPDAYRVLPGGTVEQNMRSPLPARAPQDVARMPPGAYVFDTEHAGEALDLAGELVREDPERLRKQLEAERFSEERVESIRRYCARARSATDRALMFAGLSAGLCFRGGMANWSVLCLTEPAYVREIHEVVTEHAVQQVCALLPGIAASVDILMLSADDQGTQVGPILPPPAFRELYVPYYRRLNDEVHRLAPQVKSFLHCCGAVYELLEHIIESGFDVLNPVQWSAGRHSFREWKERWRGRICLWGGRGGHPAHPAPGQPGRGWA
jgi:uroporphyrinogen decarboxylase